jgi:hypothetical protein
MSITTSKDNNDSDLNKFLDETDSTPAAIALIELAQGKRRRADWAFNPSDVFICSNGHLQYNVNEHERNEMIARGVTLPPIAYEGGLCRYCTEQLSKLTDDPKQLQQKLGTAMERAAQLGVMLEAQTASSDDYNRIVMFMRQSYAWEIETGEMQHDGQASKAIIHYLKLERKRASVVWGKRWRAIWRLVGVR